MQRTQYPTAHFMVKTNLVKLQLPLFSLRLLIMPLTWLYYFCFAKDSGVIQP